MANRLTKIIDGEIQVKPFIQALEAKILSALPGGAVAVDLYRPEDQKSDSQRCKFHAMIGDINKTGVIKIPGRTIRMADYDADQCKALLVMWFANEKQDMGEPLSKPPRSFLDPITGQSITIRPSTIDWGKKLTGEFVEWLYVIGACSGVIWSEPALKEYESYKESQK